MDDFQPKAGDEVVLRIGYSYCRHELAKVDRVTKTWAKIGPRNYRLGSGVMIGLTRYDTPQRAMMPTQELRDTIERQNLIEFAKRVVWDHVSLEGLRAVKAAVVTKPLPPTGEGE